MFCDTDSSVNIPNAHIFRAYKPSLDNLVGPSVLISSYLQKILISWF